VKKPPAPELIDYNGTGIWSRDQIIDRLPEALRLGRTAARQEVT